MAARQGGEKDEEIFQMIGLLGTWTWPAEYPFTGRTLAPEPYRKMTPRLPDGHHNFGSFSAGIKANSATSKCFLSYFSYNFRLFSAGFFNDCLEKRSFIRIGRL